MLLNLVVYFIYKLFIYKRVVKYANTLEELNQRINKLTSKRRDKVYKRLYKDIKKYNNNLYLFSMLQSFILLGLYLVGLVLIFSFNFAIYLPYHIPVLTIQVSNKYEALEGPILFYILSFLLFTPLSLRRPKANLS